MTTIERCTHAMPEATSSADILLGYVGKDGRCSVAAAVKPKVEAKTKGIVNLKTNQL